MNLTAQWVRSRALDCAGVNAHLYRSPGFQAPHWNAGDERALCRQVEEHFQNPGKLVGSRLQVPPGGNDVLAFLDVIATEDFTAAQLQRLLATRPRGSALEPGKTHVWTAEGGAARYQASRSLAHVIQTIFSELEKVMVALFTTGRGDGPLRIRVESTEGGKVYGMDPDSLLRLSRIHGFGWTGPRVRVGTMEAQDFTVARGADVRDQLIEVLTGLDQTYVRNLGGAEFVDADTGRILRSWPDDVDEVASDGRDGHE